MGKRQENGVEGENELSQDRLAEQTQCAKWPNSAMGLWPNPVMYNPISSSCLDTALKQTNGGS